MTTPTPQPACSPSPWTVAIHYDPPCAVVTDANEEMVATVYEGHDAELGMAESTIKANAHLIARAPETARLLGELVDGGYTRCLAFCQSGYSRLSECDCGRKALLTQIQKLEGGGE